MRILIQGGTVVTATDMRRADVLIENETVIEVGQPADPAADRVIDATDRLVIPGGIDPHTHLDMPLGDIRSADDFETGTVAAAFGGTTTVLDFAVQDRGGTMRAALDTWQARAADKAVIDYGFHMILAEFNDALAAEMDAIADAGVPSFKLFMAYPGRLMLDDGAIFRVMQHAKEIGAHVLLHAENGYVIDTLVRQALERGETGPDSHAPTRPAHAEAEAVHRGIALAEMAGVPVYIVHLSSAEALAEVRRAAERGVRVFAETCPQYLFRSVEDYDAPGFEGAKYVMSPPLREKAGQADLWRGLAEGALQTVGTDHCPFSFDDPDGKQRGRSDFTQIPNGAPGIEDRLTLLYQGGVIEGRFDERRWVEVSSTAAARIFGLYPRKGTVAPGSDADLVVFDPRVERTLSAATHHMNVDYNLYEGMRVRGLPEIVISRGEVVIENGTLCGAPGRGRFLTRIRPTPSP
jgi:dihydropyrimidinase